MRRLGPALQQRDFRLSGLAAFLVGTIPAVVGGGVITMLIAAGWSRIFPALADVDRLDQVAPPFAGPVQAGALG